MKRTDAQKIQKVDVSEHQPIFSKIQLKKAQTVKRVWDEPKPEVVELKHHEFEVPPQSEVDETPTEVKMTEEIEEIKESQTKTKRVKKIKPKKFSEERLEEPIKQPESPKRKPAKQDDANKKTNEGNEEETALKKKSLRVVERTTEEDAPEQDKDIAEIQPMFSKIQLKKAETKKLVWDDAKPEAVQLKHHEFEVPPQSEIEELASNIIMTHAIEGRKESQPKIKRVKRIKSKKVLEDVSTEKGKDDTEENMAPTDIPMEPEESSLEEPTDIPKEEPEEPPKEEEVRKESHSKLKRVRKVKTKRFSEEESKSEQQEEEAKGDTTQTEIPRDEPEEPAVEIEDINEESIKLPESPQPEQDIQDDAKPRASTNIGQKIDVKKKALKVVESTTKKQTPGQKMDSSEDQPIFSKLQLKKSETKKRVWDESKPEAVQLKHHELEVPPQMEVQELCTKVIMTEAIERRKESHTKMKRVKKIKKKKEGQTEEDAKGEPKEETVESVHEVEEAKDESNKEADSPKQEPAEPAIQDSQSQPSSENKQPIAIKKKKPLKVVERTIEEPALGQVKLRKSSVVKREWDNPVLQQVSLKKHILEQKPMDETVKSHGELIVRIKN